jgi:predicted membrane channel-forming protein YqfA (hemolysin III family)
MRIFSIRLVAVCFLILGLWNIFLFFQGMFMHDSANLAYVVIGIILFRAGDNLYALKEIGRKLALGILGIHVLQIIYSIYLAVFQKDFTFTWTGLGTSFHSDSVFFFAALLIPWLIIEVLFGVLLLQGKTKLLFQRKIHHLPG